MKQNTYYFNKPGKHNTDGLLSAVKERVLQGGIDYVVVATSSGKTALKLFELLAATGVKIVAVGLHAGFNGGDEISIPYGTRKILEEKNIPLVLGTHALSGIGRSISNKFGGTTSTEIISHTLRMFCGHGTKVAVEVSIMAADAGKVPTNANIVAIGGSHGGADTAIVLKPAHMNNFFDLEIREFIAKPIKGESGA